MLLMTFTIFTRLGALVFAGFLLLSLLTACTPEATTKAQAEAYIRVHVSELSPTPAVLGGTFYVTDIEWIDEDTAIVSYEDGHIALQGRTDIVRSGDETRVTTFVIVEDYGYEDDSASSRVTRPRAKEGEFCGGIAGFLCEDGLTCQYDGNYPDAGGVCVR